MKILDIATAKKIALEHFEGFTPLIHKDFQHVHSYKVGIVAKMIGKKMGIESDVFEIAGWVHDIGYIRDPKEHAVHSVSILQEQGYVLDEVILDCILHHGNSHTPSTMEGKIFQLADKLSIFDTDLLEVMCKDTEFPFDPEGVAFLKEMGVKASMVLEKFADLQVSKK